MQAHGARSAEFEVGKYVCPGCKRLMPLMASEPLVFLHWPVVVKCCPGCGSEHKLELADVRHPPVYGYE